MLQKGVRVFEQLLLVPFFITAWGAAYYGEWLTLTIIPSVLAFSDMGFGTAAANSFILAYAAGEKQKAVDINKSALWMITLTIGMALLVSFFVIFILNYFNVFEKSLIDKQEAITAVSILILARLLDFYSQMFESYFRAARKAALGTNLHNIRTILNISLGMLVLLLGYGVVEFAITQLIVTLLFNLYYRYKGRKMLFFFTEYLGKKDKQIYKELWKKGLGYLMYPVWQSIYFQGTTFVVRILLGPESVAVFNTVRTLSRSVNQIYSMLGGIVLPELQFEIGIGNWAKAQKLFRVSVMATFIVSLIGTLFLLFFGMWFYSIWTHNELVVPNYVWPAMVFATMLNAFWWTASVIFKAVNQPYKLAIYGMSSALISVLVTYLLTNVIGLLGAAIGMVILELLMALLVLPNACKMMNISIKGLLKDSFMDFFEQMKYLIFKIKKK
jgi:O-antigen/teichoic acid export membrane protein